MFQITDLIISFADGLRYTKPNEQFIKQHLKAVSEKVPNSSRTSKICEIVPYIIDWYFKSKFKKYPAHSALEDEIAKELARDEIIKLGDYSLMEGKYKAMLLPKVIIMDGKEEKAAIHCMYFIEDIPVMVMVKYGKNAQKMSGRQMKKYREISDFIKKHWEKDPALVMVVNKSSFTSMGGKENKSYDKAEGKIKLAYNNYKILITYLANERRDLMKILGKLDDSTETLRKKFKEGGFDFK
ncbi:hypothetical protein DRJ25_03355 [Candidatus Woesearchaeota archaeon]|nr:MAG: hypothetical protein DRJ25_03355 [Candidatus Woesearchaeota archaeon]